MKGAAHFDREWKATYEEFVVLWDGATKDAIAGAKKGGATFTTIDTAPFDAKLEPLARSFLKNDVQQELYRKTREAASAS